MNKKMENLLIFSVVGVSAFLIFGKSLKKKVSARPLNDGFSQIGVGNGLAGISSGGSGGNLTGGSRVAGGVSDSPDRGIMRRPVDGYDGTPECINGMWDGGINGGQPCGNGGYVPVISGGSGSGSISDMFENIRGVAGLLDNGAGGSTSGGSTSGGWSSGATECEVWGTNCPAEESTGVNILGF